MTISGVRTVPSTTASSTAPAITLPVGILGGECIRVTIDWNNGGTGVTCSTPAGFTMIDSMSYGSISVATFFKVAAGTVGAASTDSGASVTATLSTGKAWTVSAKVFIGSHPTTPIHAHAIASNASTVTTHTAPAVTVTIANCWLDEGVADRSSTVTGYTPPAVCSTHPLPAGPGAFGSPVVSNTADSGAAVATGTRGGDVWTGTAATNLVITWTVAIAPAGASAPVASFSASSSGGFTVTVDGTASTASSPATLIGYDWDWGDGSTHGAGATAKHVYAVAGTYNVVLTVTDSTAATGTAASMVTVTAPPAVVLPVSVIAPGFAATGGTQLGVFLDPLESTFDTSPGTPTGAVKTYYFAEVAAPLAGQGLYFETLTDRLNSTSGSFTAKLYQDTAKTVLISTVTSISVPDGSSSASHPDSTNTPPMVVNFPASDVAAMTDFSTPTVELTETAA